jgi:transposase
MEKIDARKLPSTALEEKRRLTVKLRKQGMTRAEISEVVGVHPDTVGRWLKAYDAQGAKGLKSQVQGRCEGVCRRLNVEQESQIQKLLIDKTPDQLKLPYALWTRE